MPEPFKNKFSPDLVIGLAAMLRTHLPDFDERQFINVILNNFASLELKQRSARITQALYDFMPQELSICKSTIETILHPEDIEEFALAQSDENGLRGWMVMPVADFVSRRWLPEDFLEGLHLLKLLTRRFSAEFAIRDFILADQSAAFQEIYRWTGDPNEHVRRLASEGTRTRLPWGRQLPALMADPTPLLPILETLLDDDSEYVRRSVANNLNDIAKDNPDFVLSFAAKYKDENNQQRIRVLKHACRSLFKQGDELILALFGFDVFNGVVNITNMTKSVQWGADLYFELEIQPVSAKPQSLMLDYIIWHQKANAKQTPKVFKWKVIEDFSKTTIYQKKHSFKPVTTRKYYPGIHKIQIQINGLVYAEQEFELLDKA